MTPAFVIDGVEVIVLEGPIHREPTYDEAIDIGVHLAAALRRGEILPGLLEVPGVGNVRVARKDDE